MVGWRSFLVRVSATFSGNVIRTLFQTAMPTLTSSRFYLRHEFRLACCRCVCVFFSEGLNPLSLSLSLSLFLSDYYHHWRPEQTVEKRFFKYKQDVSPSRASSAKQRTEWGGKGLHTSTERDTGADVSFSLSLSLSLTLFLSLIH